MKPWLFLCIIPFPVVAAALLTREAPATAVEVPHDVRGPLALSGEWSRGLSEPVSKDPVVASLRQQILRDLSQHDFRRAIERVGQLRAREPRDLWAAAVMTDALVELGEIDSAESELQKFLDVKPCGASYCRAAYLLHVRGRHDDALKTMELARESFNPKDLEARAWTLAEIGDMQGYRGRIAEAEAAYRKALVVKPEFPGALAGLSRIAAARGRIEEAIRLLEPAATSPQLLSDLAFLYQRAGRDGAARHALRRALHLQEADPSWARSTALALADHKLNPAEAVRLARLEMDRRPGIPSWDALSWALTSEGNFAEALSAARRALAFGTEEPLMLYHAGKAAAGAGSRDEARRWLGRALELNAGFHVTFGEDARQTLNTLKEKTQ